MVNKVFSLVILYPVTHFFFLWGSEFFIPAVGLQGYDYDILLSKLRLSFL